MSWLLRLPSGAGFQEDGSFVLPLRHAIQRDDDTKVSELCFREPRGADFMGLPAPQAGFLDAQALFGTKLCGITLGEFRELRGVDASRFMEVSGAFFGGAPEVIGSGPSGS